MEVTTPQSKKLDDPPSLHWGIIEYTYGLKIHSGQFQPFQNVWKAGRQYAKEAFSTYFILPEEAQENPTMWDGPVWALFMPIDIDRVDLDEALGALQQLLFYWGVCGCPLSSLRIYFSGAKGFHVHIPEAVFGGFPKRWDLPLVLRVLAEKLRGDVGLDTSIYQTNRLWRLPNSRHASSGLFKRLLTVDEVRTLGMAQIQELAKTPLVPLPPVTAKRWPLGVKLLEEACNRSTLPYKPTYKSGSNTAPDDFLCFQEIEEKGVKEGEREQAGRWLASHYLRSLPGIPEDVLQAVMGIWNAKNNPPLNDQELEAIVAKSTQKPLDPSCSKVSCMVSHCQTTCRRYEQALIERGQKAKGVGGPTLTLPPAVSTTSTTSEPPTPPTNNPPGGGGEPPPDGPEPVKQRRPAREVVLEWAQSRNFMCRIGDKFILPNGIFISRGEFKDNAPQIIIDRLHNEALEVTPSWSGKKSGIAKTDVTYKVFRDAAGAVFAQMRESLADVREVPVSKLPDDIRRILVDSIVEALAKKDRFASRSDRRHYVSTLVTEIEDFSGTDWTAITTERVWARRIEEPPGFDVAIGTGLRHQIRGMAQGILGDGWFLSRLEDLGVGLRESIRVYGRKTRTVVLSREFSAQYLFDL